LFEEIEQDVLEKERFVVEQTDKLRQMNENYVTMLDYERVLVNVAQIIPKLHGGNLASSVISGGNEDEEEKNMGNLSHFSINPAEEEGKKKSEKTPLIQEAFGDVMITNIAGTIQAEEKVRMKKLLFRATRGKALTFFQDYELPQKNKKGVSKVKSVYIVVFQEGF